MLRRDVSAAVCLAQHLATPGSRIGGVRLPRRELPVSIGRS